MGLNTWALVAGLVLTYLGMKGEDAVALLREKRPSALFNENFASYLAALPPNTIAPGPFWNVTCPVRLIGHLPQHLAYDLISLSRARSVA